MNNYTIFARDETRIPIFENMDCIVVGTVDILSANGTFKKTLTVADEWLHWLQPFIFTILFDIDFAITTYLAMIVIAL